MHGFLASVEHQTILWVKHVIYGQVAVVIALLLFLILHKLRTEHRQRAKDAKKQEMSKTLCQEIFKGEPAVLTLRNSLDYRAFSECCTDMILSFGGDYANKVRSLLVRFGAVDYYRRMSASPFWLRRYYAVEQLGMFAVDGTREFLRQRLQTERSYPVKTRIIWALSRIADEDAFRDVTVSFASTMSLSGKFEETIFATMIRAMIQRGLKATLIQRVEATISCDDIPVSVRKHLIEALGSTKFRESAPCVAACALQHAQYIEMRLACIRAAGRILGPQGTGEMDPSLGAGLAGLAALISEGLADEDWRIRAVAATASCSCGSAVIPRLIPLLSDSAYTVRLNSARALHELGPEGRLCLMEQMSSPDRFARETITFVLQSTGSAAMPVQPTAP